MSVSVLSSGPGPVPGLLSCHALGPLAVEVDGVPADLGGPKQRLLLAVLLCRAGSVVGADELLDALWSGRPPRTARKNVQVYVCKLRRIFGDRLSYVRGGYRLRLGPGDCDLIRFEQLARLGRHVLRDGDPQTAAELFDQCVRLWDEPLAEFADQPALHGELAPLRELFLAVLEDWAELALERGDLRTVLDRLGPHARGQLLRERLATTWIQALAAAGRIDDAVAHYARVRRALADELGMDPGPELARVYGQLIDGRTPAPTPARRWSLGTQLPRDLPDFVGRSTELAILAERFDRSGVAVVSGPVGCGKTAFAVHSGHLLRERFPDGQVLESLAYPDGSAKPAGVVVAELLDLVGLGEQISASHALAKWRAWLANRRVLLIFDDASREDVVRALLAGSAGSGFIVVSRHRLSGLESVLRIPLPALTESECLELLGGIAGTGRVLSDRLSARRLLACCDGSPLAVRIIGAKLTALRHLRLADYVARFRDPQCVLDELAAGALALRPRYEAFYRELSPLQAQAFRRLVRMPPPYEHGPAVAALADLSASPERVLDSLFDCNLLSAPDHEVDAHYASYAMPLFAYWFGKSLG